MAQPRNSRCKSVVALDSVANRGSSRIPCECLRGLFGEFGETDEVQGSPELVARCADPKAVAREAVVLVMVGLPARGKSYLSGAVFRHLRLLGVRVRSFNAGELRRSTGAAGGAGAQADFFSVSNKDAKQERERLAMTCCEKLLEWIRVAPPNTSSVGILDATNTTKARRSRVLQLCQDAAREMAAEDEGKFAPLRVIFLESICEDPRLLKDNYRMKLRNDDYKGASDHEAALQDFQARVAAYEAQYEPVEDRELEPTDERDVPVPAGCVRIIDGGLKIVCCRTGASLVAAPALQRLACRGPTAAAAATGSPPQPAQAPPAAAAATSSPPAPPAAAAATSSPTRPSKAPIISLLHAMHLTPRRILLVARVSEDGVEVQPDVLASLLMQAERKEGQPIDVLCNAGKRGYDLAQHLEQHCSEVHSPGRGQAPRHQPRAVLTLRALNTRSSESGEVKESYADLVRRMRSEVILLIERLPRSVAVVCPGEDVRRVLMAHFIGCDSASISDMRVPKGKVLQLNRDHKGFQGVELPLPH